MAADKSQKQENVIDEARNEGRKVHCASLLDICHVTNTELVEPRHQKIQR